MSKKYLIFAGKFRQVAEGSKADSSGQGGRAASPVPLGAFRVNGKDGFTLVELLIVIAVIAILAAIAVMAYNKVISKAKQASAISYVNSIVKAEQIFLDINNRYTDNFSELETTQVIPFGTGNPRAYGDYTFTLTIGVDGGGAAFWNVIAVPTDGDITMRWYYSDATGIIRYEVGAAPSASSPPI